MGERGARTRGGAAMSGRGRGEMRGERRQREEEEKKWRAEVDVEDRGPCLGCWSRKIDCVRE